MSLTLCNGTSISGNDAEQGGGVYIRAVSYQEGGPIAGDVTYNGVSISSNFASEDGDGVYRDFAPRIDGPGGVQWGGGNSEFVH
ncbi:MAG TPA: hypothetical protein VH092_07920 [Urbifossiella sp.]|nr:hypothetical protein [Urbifossiella sp.]